MYSITLITILLSSASLVTSAFLPFTAPAPTPTSNIVMWSPEGSPPDEPALLPNTGTATAQDPAPAPPTGTPNSIMIGGAVSPPNEPGCWTGSIGDSCGSRGTNYTFGCGDGFLLMCSTNDASGTMQLYDRCQLLGADGKIGCGCHNALITCPGGVH